MRWLNYHHLLYFWTVVKEGGVKPAAARLRLAHPTVSEQIHTLEESLNQKLFERRGRRLELTDVGSLVFRYADEIFSLGTELLDTLDGAPSGRPMRLVVGLADVLPKIVARQLLRPVHALAQPVRLVVKENKPERLIEELSSHEIDVVLSDAPVPTGTPVKAFNHLLGECGVALFAAPELARTLRPKFPRSLDDAPFILPTENTVMRRSLNPWFERHGIRPRVVAEFEDSALLTSYGEDGMGVFPAPTVIEHTLTRQHGLKVVGRLDGVVERFFAISVDRRIKHPGVVALFQAARSEMFA